MQKAMTKNEFMTQYINDKYRKRYEEKKKERAFDTFATERAIKNLKLHKDIK